MKMKGEKNEIARQEKEGNERERKKKTEKDKE